MKKNPDHALQASKNDAFLRENREAIIDLPWVFKDKWPRIDMAKLDERGQLMVERLIDMRLGIRRQIEESAGHKKEYFVPASSATMDIVEKQARYRVAGELTDILLTLPWHRSFNKLYGKEVTDIYLDKRELSPAQKTILKTACELGAIEKDNYCKSADHEGHLYLARHHLLLDKLCDRFDTDPDRRVNVRYERPGWSK